MTRTETGGPTSKKDGSRTKRLARADTTPDEDKDTWTNVHENLTQAVFLDEHAWVNDYLNSSTINIYIEGEWWNDGDITPDVAVSLFSPT